MHVYTYTYVYVLTYYCTFLTIYIYVYAPTYLQASAYTDKLDKPLASGKMKSAGVRNFTVVGQIYTRTRMSIYLYMYVGFIKLLGTYACLIVRANIIPRVYGRRGKYLHIHERTYTHASREGHM